MWEYLTVALACLGFVAALTVMLMELPATVRQMRTGWLHHHGW